MARKHTKLEWQLLIILILALTCWGLLILLGERIENQTQEKQELCHANNMNLSEDGKFCIKISAQIPIGDTRPNWEKKVMGWLGE